jgi:hypothetical protein
MSLAGTWTLSWVLSRHRFEHVWYRDDVSAWFEKFAVQVRELGFVWIGG